MKASLRWPLLIAGLLALHAAGMVTYAVIASSNPSYVVEKDYYQKALHWDDTRRQDAANASLGWNVSVRAHPAEAPGRATLTLTLRDRRTTPVTGAAAHVQAFHMADSGRVLEADLQEVSPGVYAAQLPMDRDGKWELRLRVKRGDDLFTSVLKQYLVVTP